MSFSNTSIAAQNSKYLQSLVDYVSDVKPYRTKLARSGAIAEEYVFADNLHATFREKEFIRAFLGADIMPAQFTALNVRKRQSTSWYQDLISDGVRRTWPMPNITVPKFASKARREKFTIGNSNDDYTGIPGLTVGAVDQRRWDFRGITDVRVNGEHQQDSVGYYLSHGVYSFDTCGTVKMNVDGVEGVDVPVWIQHDLNNSVPTIRDIQGEMRTDLFPITSDPDPENPLPPTRLPHPGLAAYAAFHELPGTLTYQDVTRLGGTLTNITGETYEEFYAICTSVTPTPVLSVYSPNNPGVSLGTVALGANFQSLDATTGKERIAFNFAPDQSGLSSPVLGDRYEIVPFHKITVALDAPQETWSLIKINPTGLVDPLNAEMPKAPVWTPSLPPSPRPNGIPAIEVHTTSIEHTPPSNWTVEFDGVGQYTISCNAIAGYPKTISLVEGCSYRDDNIAFTILPTIDGWNAGDKFSWSVGPVTSYKVFGSVSGWTKDAFTNLDAQVGKWFWNGKIGFKIPQLNLFAEIYNSTISMSPTGNFQSWKTVVSNGQILTGVDYNNGIFLTTGHGQIIGASANGEKWTANVPAVFTPEQPATNYEFIVDAAMAAIGILDDVDAAGNALVISQRVVDDISAGRIRVKVTKNSELVPRAAYNVFLNEIAFISPGYLTVGDVVKVDILVSDMLIIQGENGSILTSTDGADWTKQDTGTTVTLRGLTQIPNFLSSAESATPDLNCLIVVGDDGTIITSIDGVGWAHQVSGTTEHLYDVSWSDSCIIAVGENGTILRSVDRVTWTPASIVGSLLPNTHVRSVIYANGKFIAVGSNGIILRSIDGGLNWTIVSPALAPSEIVEYSDIAYGNGTFVAVGPTGHIAQSDDGDIWPLSKRYSGKIFNSITFGEGKFVAVGGSTNTQVQFTPSKPPSIMTEPSTYFITFTKSSDTSAIPPQPGEATVYNNITGYGRNLKTGEIWEDEWVSFKLDTVPGLYEYYVGDVIKVHVADSKICLPDLAEFSGTGSAYGSAETSIRNRRTPLLTNSELYPLYHSHGAVIFPDAVVGDKVVVDKAFDETIRLKIEGSTALFPELGAVDDWLPLYFKYSDYVAPDLSSASTKPAEFSDLGMFIEAFSAASGKRVFHILSPRFNKTNQASQSRLTFDNEFFEQYLRFNTRYSIAVYPDDSYGQHVRVKVTEALKVYARVHLDLNDIALVQITDVDPTLLDIYSELYFGEGPITGYWQWNTADFTYIAAETATPAGPEVQRLFTGPDADGHPLIIDAGLIDLEASGKRKIKVKVNSVDVPPDQYTLSTNAVTFNDTFNLRANDKVSVRVLAYASPSSSSVGHGPTGPAHPGSGWKFITPFNTPNDSAWTYPFNINITEGGAAIADLYDTNPYDMFLYDESGVMPFFQIFEKNVTNTTYGPSQGQPETAQSAITEGLSITTKPSDPAAVGLVVESLTFDVAALQPFGDPTRLTPGPDTGLRIKPRESVPGVESLADAYVVTLVQPRPTPAMPAPTSLAPSNLIFAPADNLADITSIPADFTTYSYLQPDGSTLIVTDPNSVTFTTPVDFKPATGPHKEFRLWIV